MNDKNLERVREFHTVYGLPINDNPFINDIELNDLRYDLFDEEFVELFDGLRNGDAVEVFDALCDLQYVLDGTFLALGFAKYKEAGMAEVHRSNMSKLGEDGKPIYREDGKVLKGPNFSEPDLESVLNGSN